MSSRRTKRRHDHPSVQRINRQQPREHPARAPTANRQAKGARDQGKLNRRQQDTDRLARLEQMRPWKPERHPDKWNDFVVAVLNADDRQKNATMKGIIVAVRRLRRED